MATGSRSNCDDVTYGPPQRKAHSLETVAAGKKISIDLESKGPNGLRFFHRTRDRAGGWKAKCARDGKAQ